MRAVQWLAAQVVVGACLYFGYAADMPGARNVFYAWLALCMVFVLSSEKTDAAAIKAYEEPRSVPSWVSRPWRLAVMAWLIWFGAWGALLALLILTGFYEGMRLKGKRLLAERAA